MVTKVLRPIALVLLCGGLMAGARAQRVGPVEDEPAALPASVPARAESKGEAKREAEETKAAPKSDAKNPRRTAQNLPPQSAQKHTATASAARGERAAASTTSAPAAAVSDVSPQAGEPRVTVSPSVGSLPALPKYEPPPPLKAESSSVSPPSASSSTESPSAIYRVGAGDILDIRLSGGLARDATLFTVLSNGTIDYPLAGEPVSAIGLTPEEIGSRLSAALKRRGIYDRAHFQISVRDYASHTVLVSGLVDQPGQKFLRREAVPLYVVLAEAFPRADAGRVVIISRATGQTKTLDLADSASLGELVSHGDVINVQPRPREFFYVGGQINSPGQKDYTTGMTLTQALLAAGGVAGGGDKTRVVVSRQGADGRLVSTEYALAQIQSGKVPDPHIQAGDRIEVVKKR